MLELLILLEGIIRLKLPWLPVSLHHDGFAVLADSKSLKEDQSRLQLFASSRMESLGFAGIELEFTPYDSPSGDWDDDDEDLLFPADD
jgi:hypothetical protein